jgi:membrane protein DedA with SNARE-associated domain
VRPLPLIAAGLLLAGAIAGQPGRSRLTRVLMLLGAVGLATVGAGLLNAPNLEHLLRDTVSTLGPYTYVLVAVMAFLETGAGIGLIAPGELVVILGGVAAGQGEIELAPLIALVWASAVAGDAVSFLLGRRLGRGFLITHGHRIRLTPRRLGQIERYFAQHGGKTILVGRFIGLIRSLAPFIAGASNMPARRFLPMTAAAAGIWAAACTLVGYVFWNSIDDAIALAKQGSLAIAALLTVTIAATFALKRLRDRDPATAIEASHHADSCETRAVAGRGRPRSWEEER